MRSGQFNFHKVMFTLDVFASEEEKVAYLTHLDNELNRVITCFEKHKILPLRAYAEAGNNIPDICNEFSDFIKLMIDKYSPSFSDKRIPGNYQLQQLVNEELFEFKKLKEIINNLLSEIRNAKTENTGKLTESNFETVNIDQLPFSIKSRASKKTVKKKEYTGIPKIVWHGSASSLKKLFCLLSEENLLKDVTLEKKLEFIDKFIVNKYGKKINI